MSTEVPYDFVLGMDDEAASFERVLTDEAGEPVDLSTGVNAVTFSMRAVGSSELTVDSATTTITDAAGGTVRYDWNSADTAEPGTYLAQFVVEYTGGQTETFPNHRDLNILIRDGAV